MSLIYNMIMIQVLSLRATFRRISLFFEGIIYPPYQGAGQCIGRLDL